MIAMLAVVVVALVALLMMRGTPHHFLPGGSATPAVERLPKN